MVWGLRQGFILLVLLGALGSAAHAAQRVRTVGVATVQQEQSQRSVRTSGLVEAGHVARLYSRAAGIIKSLHLHPGDAVKNGDALIIFDNRALKARLGRTKAQLRQARSSLQRTRKLRETHVASEDELIRAETAVKVNQAELRLLEIELADSVLRAPFSGLVTERLAEPGDAVTQYRHLLTIIDPNTLIVRAHLGDRELLQLSRGATARLQASAQPDRWHTARVSRIEPQIDSSTNQGALELTPIATSTTALRPGLRVTVELDLAARERRMAPFRALRHDSTGPFMWRLDDEQILHRAAVKVGERLQNRVEILDGLEPGATVVIAGFSGLRPGAKVKVADAPNNTNQP